MSFYTTSNTTQQKKKDSKKASENSKTILETSEKKDFKSNFVTGAPNFRELGGIPTKEGRHIKEHLLFRSGVLTYLTQADLEIFKKYKIKYIFDFRNDDEIEKEPDLYPKDQEIVRLHTPISAFNQFQMDHIENTARNKHTTIATVDSLMIMVYRTLVTNIHDYKPLITAFINYDTPVLFHCTSGKDRTGFAAMLILSILNVDQDVIIEDYLLSATHLAKENEKNIEKYKQFGIPPDIFRTLNSVKRDYIEAAFDQIKKEYGTIDTMLLDVFNIDKKKQKDLILRYTY